VARHAEYTLGGASIAEVFNFAFAIPASKAVCAESLVAGEDCQVFDFIAAGIAAVCAVVADEGAIAEQEEVRIRVEEGAAGVATEAVDVPPVSSCLNVSMIVWSREGRNGSQRVLGNVLDGGFHTELKCLAFLEDLSNWIS
jgi:hypothetical protein